MLLHVGQGFGKGLLMEVDCSCSEKSSFELTFGPVTSSGQSRAKARSRFGCKENKGRVEALQQGRGLTTGVCGGSRWDNVQTKAGDGW